MSGYSVARQSMKASFYSISLFAKYEQSFPNSDISHFITEDVTAQCSSPCIKSDRLVRSVTNWWGPF